MSVERRRLIGAAAIVVLAIALVGAFASEGTSGSDRRAGGSFDRGPNGILGWSLLLDEAGHTIHVDASAPSDGGLDSDRTAVLLDPGRLAEADVESLRRFVSDGGRLILGGNVDDESLDEVSGADVGQGSSSAGELTPLVPTPELDGVAAVQANGGGAYNGAGSALPILAGPDGTSALLSEPGDGSLILLADPSPLRNGLLAEADNARMALGLAGPADRDVVFIQRVSTGEASGLAALPSSWLLVAAGLLAAALVLVWSRARRLGPPSSSARVLPPPRRAYVDALAVALARTGDQRGGGEPLRRSAGAIVARRGGLGPDPGRDGLIAAARRLGLPDSEAQAIAADPAGENDLMEAGSALARLLGKTGWR